MAKGFKTGGRKAGTPNKVDGEAKQIFADIVNKNATRAQEMLDRIVEPKEWMNAYLRLAEYVLPKKAAVNVTGEVKRSDLKEELLKLENSEN